MRSRGFTLIELIAVIVMLGVLATVAPLFVVAPTQNYVATRNNAELGYAGNLVLAQLRDDLRQAAVNLSAISVTAPTAQSLQVEQPPGGTVLSSYSCDLNAQTLSRNGSVLVREVTVCNFVPDTTSQRVRFDLTLASQSSEERSDAQLELHDTISYRRTW